MRILRRALFAALILAIMGASAGQYPPALQHLVDQGAVVLTQFDAPAGLHGYGISIEGHAMIVYTTDDGRYLISGALMDAQGHNLTRSDAEKYLPLRDFTADWGKLKSATWVAQGAQNPQVIVYNFTDLNCPYCHRFWQLARRYAGKRVQVRHIIVGVLTDTSRAKAAAVLEAKDPAAALAAAEAAFDRGGIKAVGDIDAGVLAKIKANEKLMYELGIQGTPAIFYRSASGAVHLIPGVPSGDQLKKVFDLGDAAAD